MAAPSLAAGGTNPGTFANTANATSHATVLPAPTGGILANDLLLMIAGVDGNPTFTLPGGWTQLFDSSFGGIINLFVAYTLAAGGETGTITVTTNNLEGGGWQIYCIRGGNVGSPPEISAGSGAVSTNPDPDAITPSWGTDDILAIACAAGDDGTAAATLGPASYSGFLSTRWNAVAGAEIATAWQQLSAVSTEDPGVFTRISKNWKGGTVAVRGAAAVVAASKLASQGVG